MTHLKDFVIRCDQTVATGFGHFSRCLTLARYLRDSPQTGKVIFCGDYGDFSQCLLSYYAFEWIPLQDFEFTKIPEFWSDFDCVIVDSYSASQIFIDKLTQYPFQTFFIDDMCKHDFSQADWVLNFGLRAQSMLYSAKHLLLGPAYFLAKPEFKSIRKKRIKGNLPEKPCVVVFLSGADQNDSLAYHILSVLVDKFAQWEIIYISKNSSHLKGSKFSKIKKIKPDYQIEKIYSQATLVINGGGLTKYECAYMLIPSASVSLTKLQHEDSIILENHGIICDLGYSQDLSISLLQKNIISFVSNTVLHKDILNACTKYFELESSLRIVQEIQKHRK